MCVWGGGGRDVLGEQGCVRGAGMCVCGGGGRVL